jgi:ABC-type transport system involved in multi-copper enzyme maturation permease subunit
MTTSSVLAPPQGLAARVRWGLRDSLTIAGRAYRQLLAQPGELLGFLLFPVLFTVLFGYVFGSAITLPGGGNYRQFLMPGIYTQTMAMTATVAAQKIAGDMQRGIIDRFRSLPIARSSVLLGRTLSDFSGHTLSLACMSACGLLIAGWHPVNGGWSALGAYGLLMLFGFAMMWLGTLIGLSVRSPSTADAATFGWIFPMTFLANTFVPTQAMPAWLRVIADWNPVSATVAAARQLFGSPVLATPHAWPLQHPVLASLGWSVLIMAVFIPLAVRRYRAAASR